MDDFMCDKCGLCCQNLAGNPLYEDLHDGDGICRYYDTKTHLCSIYDNRPIKCNIKKAYFEFGFDIPYSEYLSLNYQACNALKRRKLCITTN